MTTPLERFGMIGDGETAALVSSEGSIDWLCLPRFDSPACCASLLGTPENGHWSIAPDEPIQKVEQRYQIDTLILETDLTTASGTIRLTDFMPIREHGPLVVRVVTGLSGSVSATMVAAFRFDNGQLPPWISQKADAVLLQAGPDEVLLYGAQGAEVEQDLVRCCFSVGEGVRREALSPIFYRVGQRAARTGQVPVMTRPQQNRTAQGFGVASARWPQRVPRLAQGLSRLTSRKCVGPLLSTRNACVVAT